MCTTCRVIEGKRSRRGLIYKSDSIIIHHCLDVNIPGYIIISPIRHVTDYQELTDTELVAMARGTKTIMYILQKLPDVEKVYI